MFSAVLGAAAALSLAVPAGAGPTSLSAGGRSLLPEDAALAFHRAWGEPDGTTLRYIHVREMPFARALRVRVLKRPEKTYSVQLSLSTVDKVKKGEVLRVRFHLRSGAVLGKKARAHFVFERAGGDYAKSIIAPAVAGREWKAFEYYFKAADSYGPGEAQANFRLGFDAQVVEIGGVELHAFPADSQAARRTGTPLSYEGREDGAAWREKAFERIEKIRKAPLRVEVVDEDGAAFAGATVRVRMQRHAFRFGTAVSARYMVYHETANKKRYRSEILKIFNAVVIDNAVKWSQWGRQKRWARSTAEFFHDKGFAVRGHNVLWPGWSHLPDRLERYKNKPEKVRRLVDKHIQEKVGKMRGVITEWDVINEPFDNHDLQDLLGADAAAQWFREVHALDPDARLFLNDTGVVTRGGQDREHQDGYFDIARSLLRAGAPLHALGIQAHFDMRLTDPERVLELLDRFGSLGLPLTITEYDIELADEDLRADYTRDFLIACFSHPSVDGFYLWEFWRGLISSTPEAAVVYNEDWSLRPSGEAFLGLVLDRWWTNVSGATGPDGAYTARAFHGDYEIAVTAPGMRESMAKTVVGRDGAVVKVIMAR